MRRPTVISNQKKSADIVALVLGVIICAFGFLKFFDPFRTWFHAQIAGSRLPPDALPLGITGEIVTGLALIGSFVARSRLGQVRYVVVAGACLGLIVMMLVATYVHLQPDVPAEVLPLGIKPPFIPLSFLALSVWELVRVLRLRGGAGWTLHVREK
jgi:hypothetical protein